MGEKNHLKTGMENIQEKKIKTRIYKIKDIKWMY